MKENKVYCFQVLSMVYSVSSVIYVFCGALVEFFYVIFRIILKNINIYDELGFLVLFRLIALLRIHVTYGSESPFVLGA